jgi:hypothetical protein
MKEEAAERTRKFSKIFYLKRINLFGSRPEGRKKEKSSADSEPSWFSQLNRNSDSARDFWKTVGNA